MKGTSVPRYGATACWNDLVDDAFRIRKNVKVDREAEVDAMVSRWRIVRVCVVDTVAAVAVAIHGVTPTPGNQLRRCLMLQAW